LKTLLILCHPNIEESGAQQFLISSLPKDGSVTLHHLDTIYPNFTIDVEREINTIMNHDQIIFQFPFYWYSAPALLKHWQDLVLTALQKQPELLATKKLGLIISLGVAAHEYQAGGQEQFSISELTKPFQAVARYFNMDYLSPLIISRFSYLTDPQKMNLLIDYQCYFAGLTNAPLSPRTDWMVEQLNLMEQRTTNDLAKTRLRLITGLLAEQAETIAELKEGIEGI